MFVGSASLILFFLFSIHDKKRNVSFVKFLEYQNINVCDVLLAVGASKCLNNPTSTGHNKPPESGG